MREKREVQAGASGDKFSQEQELLPHLWQETAQALSRYTALAVPSSLFLHGKHLTVVPAVTSFRIGKGAWQD